MAATRSPCGGFGFQIGVRSVHGDLQRLRRWRKSMASGSAAKITGFNSDIRRGPFAGPHPDAAPASSTRLNGVCPMRVLTLRPGARLGKRSPAFARRGYGRAASGRSATAASRCRPLDQLVAPIALYPDPVLAQVLMASTYPLEVVQADRGAKRQQEAEGRPGHRSRGQTGLGRERQGAGHDTERARHDERSARLD